ncbi:MAG: 30S ribosomal protein S20, partial [Gemmatimonadaceae bacterium]|nr:30S ribosomal protein S20 [Gemmatimonadaceae bacterium]
MPNIASAKKNMRKSRAATVRNRAQRSALRTALKKAKSPTATADERTSAISLLDRA